jgi:hypothetical protein
MSEFSINHEDPNFDDINDSLAGNIYEKNEENKIDGYNNFASLAQISTGADSEKFNEEKKEDVKESNLEVLKISQIEGIKIEKSKTEDVAIKKEEEKEVEEVIEIKPIKKEENLTKSTKSETKNESTQIGKNFILKRDLHCPTNFSPSYNRNYYSKTENYLGMEFIHLSGKILVFDNKVRIGNRLFVFYRDFITNQKFIVNYQIGENTPNYYYK